MIRCKNCGWDNPDASLSCEKCGVPQYYDVFISYSRKDYVDDLGHVIPNNTLSTIKDTLKANDISYWFDEEGIYSGDEFASVLTRAIRNSKVFLFISSVNSNQSKWTSNEISTALEFKKPIIPIRMDDSPYNDSVMMKIISFDYIDYKDEEKAINKLLRAVKHHLPSSASQQKKSDIVVPDGARGATVIFDVEGKRTEKIFSYENGEAKILHEKTTTGDKNSSTGESNRVYLRSKSVKWLPYVSAICFLCLLLLYWVWSSLTPEQQTDKHTTMLYGVRDSVSGLFGFIDETGKLVVPYQWKNVGAFSEGLGAVQDSTEEWGFIDKTGKLVIPCLWKDVSSFSDSFAKVETYDMTTGFIDKTGRTAFSCQWYAEKFSDGMAKVYENERYGFIDRNGKLVIQYKWKNAGNYYEGLAWVENDNGNCGYIDKSGKEIIVCQWAAVSNFSEGLAGVASSKDVYVDQNGNHICKFGYIDKTGKLVIPFQWTFVGDFSEGLAWVEKDNNNKKGYIDLKGNVVIPYKWEKADNFSNGLAAVRMNDGKWGYIDKTGKIVIKCKWKEAGKFIGALAEVEDFDNRWWWIDRNGSVIGVRE